MWMGSLFARVLPQEDLQVHTEHIVSIPHNTMVICHVLMYSSCKRCPADDASACILPYILVSLIYSPILPAVDARGVGCAALQGTPFSSTHSSSTADLKRLQSLGEAAFSQTLSLLSDKQFTKYCKMCSHILDFRFPDRRKN